MPSESLRRKDALTIRPGMGQEMPSVLLSFACQRVVRVVRGRSCETTRNTGGNPYVPRYLVPMMDCRDVWNGQSVRHRGGLLSLERSAYRFRGGQTYKRVGMHCAERHSE